MMNSPLRDASEIPRANKRNFCEILLEFRKETFIIAGGGWDFRRGILLESGKSEFIIARLEKKGREKQFFARFYSRTAMINLLVLGSSMRLCAPMCVYVYLMCV